MHTLTPKQKPSLKSFDFSNEPQLGQQQYAVILPAAPGFYVLELCSGESGEPAEVIKHPVIGWGICCKYGFHIPDAITLGGTTADSDALLNAPVLEPGGLVRLGTDMLWDSIDHYLAERQEDYQEEQQQRQRCEA